MSIAVVKFGENEFKIKQSFRALLEFEKMSKKKISDMEENITDVMMLFYCILKVNNLNFNYSFDSFVDMVDENIDAFQIFTDYLNEQAGDNKDISNDSKKK